MSQVMLQGNFTLGEFSPKVHARSEFDGYYRGARMIRNALVMPQGGVEVRFGTIFATEIESISDYTEAKGFLFDYQTTTKYLLLFTNELITIYLDDVEVATVVTTYSTSEIAQLRFSESNNLLAIVHPNHSPAILYRTAGGPEVWTLNASPTFSNYPTFDFANDYDALTFTFLTSMDMPIDVSDNYIGNTLHVLASSAYYTADLVGGLFYGAGGTFRITSFIDSTHIAVLILKIIDMTFDGHLSVDHVPGTLAVITEPVFSATRGWPSVVTFFQNRLYFGNTVSLPGGVWGSEYNGFSATILGFDDSDDLDTNAISTVILSSRNIAVLHFMTYKSLIIYTTNGMFSTPVSSIDPITPSNIAFINTQTPDVSSDVEPQLLDNQPVFFIHGGRRVKNVTFDMFTSTYKTSTISVLAEHMIQQPVSSGIFYNSSTKDGVYLMAANGSGIEGDPYEGTLAVYQSLAEQSLTAWTLQYTGDLDEETGQYDGKFRQIIADQDLVYFITQRTINGSEKFYVERLSFDVRTDCAFVHTYMSPTSVITGLDYLEGKTVRILGDGFLQTDQVVIDGSITLDTAATSVEIGLDYNPLVVPMPVNLQTPIGDNLYLPKFIKTVYIDSYGSLGILVNGELLPFMDFGVDHLNTPAIPKTGVGQVSVLNGWSPDQSITISQRDPLPFNLLGIGLLIEV